MNSLKTWFYILTILPFFIIFGKDLSMPGFAINIFTFGLLAFPFILFFIIKGEVAPIGKRFPLIYISLILIIFNITNSYEPEVSLSYWLLYIIFTYGFCCWFLVLKKESYDLVLTFFKKSIIYFVIISLIFIYIGLVLLDYGSAKTFNSFGIISGSAFAFFWFIDIKKKIIKWSVLALLFYFLIVSLSRSSLIFSLMTILIIEFFFIKNNGIKRIAILISSLGFLLFFSELLVEWIAQKETISNFNSLSNIGTLADDRIMLMNNFLKVYKNNFFFGYGINTDYKELSEWRNVGNIGVHNGILEMILTVGVPLSIIILYFVFISFKKLFFIARKDESFAAMFSFSFYCILRSYGESYFVLNLGNIMSIVFILMLVFINSFKIKKTSF